MILTDAIEIVILELPKIYRLKETNSNNELLDWLYFLEDPSSERVMDVMDNNEGIKEAKEKLEEMSNDVVMQRLAEYRESAIIEENEIRNTALHKGREQGKAEGLKEGRESERLEMAKKMKQIGIDINSIIKVTGLSKEEIDNL